MLRLGLAGMRVAEIVHLQIGNLRLGRDPTVEWIGKKARLRKVAVAPSLLHLLDDYLAPAGPSDSRWGSRKPVRRRACGPTLPKGPGA